MKLLRIFISKLATAVIMLLVVSLCGLWLMQQIPESTIESEHDDPNIQLEQTDHPTLNKISPLFYWSFIPEFTTDQLRAPEKISLIKKLPQFRWNGMHNLYHQWLFHSTFSLRDSRPVYQKVIEAIQWTIIVQLPALLLIIVIGFWLAEWSVRTNLKVLSNSITNILTAFHSIPVFWLSSLLLILFAGRGFFNIFPSSFVSSEHNYPFDFWTYKSYYLVLPLISIVLPSLSVVYNMVRTSMLTHMKSTFWMRLLSTGVQVKDGIKQEIRPLAAIPMMAWIASAIPMLISGSIIVENIFSIPGTGRLLLQSIAYKDWPVVHGLMMTASALTMIGIQLADFLQSRIDPRL